MKHTEVFQACKAVTAEHLLTYAYPMSPRAKELGFNAQGCYVIELAGSATATGTYAEAKAAVSKLGTVPGRWSMDHPDNARYFPHYAGSAAASA